MNVTEFKKNKGSILLLAVMIILIFSVIGLAVLKTQETSGETIAQDVLGTRALMAARAGIESSLIALFPLNDTTQACNNTTLILNDVGLLNCNVSVSCDLYASVNAINYYRLQSTGQCGIDTIEANSTNGIISSRTVQVEARTILR